MKNILLFIIVANLLACSFGGFKPPRETEHWDIKVWPKGYTLEEYIEQKNKDMRACGIDPVAGYHTSVEQGLCMENRGWYYTKGPVCEDIEVISDEAINGPLCSAWRAKTGRPKPPVKK